MRQRLFVWLVLVSGLALWWPAWFGSKLDPFLALAAWLPWCIAGIMFSLGWMLPADEIHQVARRWPMVLAGTALQYTVMPLLAVGCGWLFLLRGEQLVGIAFVGCVPGAMASNVLTHLARGNTSYSVSLTAASTLLSPLVVPLVLGLALQGQAEVQIDPWSTARQLLLTVVLPVLAGNLLARCCKSWHRPAARLATISANVLLLWVIATVVALNRDHLTAFTQGGRSLLALATVNLLGYLAGYYGGMVIGLPEPMRRALTIEVGMQNAGLGAVLALRTMPDQPAVAILPALYMFGCMATGTLLAQWWSTRPPTAVNGPTADGGGTTPITR